MGSPSGNAQTPARASSHSGYNCRRNSRCLRDLRNRYDIFPAGVADNRPLRNHNGVARSNCRGEYVGGPPPSLMAARNPAVRAHNEDGALVRQSRGAAALREIPTGVLTRHLGNGIGARSRDDPREHAAGEEADEPAPECEVEGEKGGQERRQAEKQRGQ